MRARRLSASITAIGMTLCVSGALGKPVDCPLAHEPYSSRSPLLDLLIDPAARTVVERVAPGLLVPPFGPTQWSTEAPTFAAILTPAAMLRLQPQPGPVAAQLDAALASIPVTAKAAEARCARYDHAAPELPTKIPRPAVLVFEKSTGFRDAPSVEAAAAALDEIAKRHGWTLVTSHAAAVFNSRDLARFDAVVWNNVSGDVLTVPQRQAFRKWIERGGGGYVGIHGSGGDPVYFWDWYVHSLVGAQFVGHPMNPQFQEAMVVVEDRNNPVTAGLGDGWRMTEEWYSFATTPRADGARVLARLDESTYSPVGLGGTDLHMGDHPITWSKCVGRGRSFYTAIGHRPENYREPHSVRLLEQGIAWAMDRSAVCSP